MKKETKQKHIIRSCQSFDSVLLIMCFICSLFGIILNHTNPEYASVLSFIKYICILTLYIKYAEMSLSFFVPLFFFIFMWVLSVISPFSYSFGRMVVVGMVPLWLYVLTKALMNQQYVKWVIAILIVYIVYVMAVLDKSLINSNLVAFCCLMAFINIYSLKNLQSISNYLFFSISLLCFLGIILTDSRTSFLVFLILFISQYLQKFQKVALFFFVICVLGVITPYLYTILANIYKASHNEVFMGQEVFSGRDFVWDLIFYYFRDVNHLLYGGIDLWEWDKSYHNSLFDIWVDFGLICLIVCVSIYTYFFRLYELSVSSKAYKVFYIIILSLTWGYFESGWFLGCAIPILFPILFISKINR